MRNQMGMMVVEDQKGEVAVQLFAEADGPFKAFDGLVGNPADLPSRATYISLKYGEDGKLEVSAKSKMLPVVEPVSKRPDGFVLGEGPVKFDDEKIVHVP